MKFSNWALSNQRSLHVLFPELTFDEVAAIDMSSGSNFFGMDPQHDDLDAANLRIQLFQEKHPKALLANGYLEQRSFYNTPAFERVLKGVKEFRNIHLGTDFWIPAETPIHACWDGEVVISHDNDYHKDYGGTLVLKHRFSEISFYTLYGHLSKSSLLLSPKGKKVSQGERIAFIGNELENGHWVPHLHFQLITDLMEEAENFNGVAFPSEIAQWRQRCPNPDLVFTETLPSAIL